MCDTMVARPGTTANGGLIFAKNSDREANEAQFVCAFPAVDYEPGAQVSCTYIDIPQAHHTHGVLLSRPYWMWGAEMGTNDQGVVIGNEAVFAKQAPMKESALLGMDLLRLALERAASAAEAVEVIASLLADHGQGGNCAHTGEFHYHNSFLIADSQGNAIVMETMGREWAVEQVASIRSISNTYTIGTQIDGESAGLRDVAKALGWQQKMGPLNLTDAIASRVAAKVSSGPERWCRTTDLLVPKAGTIGAADMMAVLRDHGPRAAANPNWRPDGILGTSVCAHASWGPFRAAGQTTGSWITEFQGGRPVHWITGTSAPDTGIFKPVFFGPGWEGVELPDFGPAPTDQFDEKTLWWRHEKLHRAVLQDYAPRIGAFADERTALEVQFQEEVARFMAGAGSRDDAGRLLRHCWKTASVAEESWLETVRNVPPQRRGRPSALYRRHWKGLNRVANFPAP
jgi:secernin